MVQFIKTLPYELRSETADPFEYRRLVAIQKIDPPGTASDPFRLDADQVFYSPLRRVQERLPYQTRSGYACRDYLREIPFDLARLCSRQQWRHAGSIAVRSRFKEAFIHDQLLIPRRRLFAQIKALLKECVNSPPSLRIAVVSHSFRLKCIESFIKTAGAIQDDPKLIHSYLHDAEVTYSFGSGFAVTREDLERAICTIPV